MKKAQTTLVKHSKEDLEAEAIQVITQALSQVPDDRKGAVLKYVAGRYNVEAATPQTPSGGGSGNQVLQRQQTTTSEDIEEFMEQKNPRNHYQRVAALAYHLDKARGLREYDNDEIVGANDEAHGPKLGNIAQIMADASNKYGFLAPGSHGKKRLTQRGKKVAEALPDQESVKRAMREYPFRIAKGGKGRKGKKQG